MKLKRFYVWREVIEKHGFIIQAESKKKVRESLQSGHKWKIEEISEEEHPEKIKSKIN